MADRQTQGHRLGVVALAAGLAVLPLGLPNDYYLTVLIVAGFHTIVTMGLNLLMGYAGQVSLGHAAFYGIAAYTTGILTAKFHWPVAAGIAAGIALVLVVAAGIAVPTLRLRGHYLAMGTLGFGVIVYIVLNEATGLTGGPSGLTGIPKLTIARLPGRDGPGVLLRRVGHGAAPVPAGAEPGAVAPRAGAAGHPHERDGRRRSGGGHGALQDRRLHPERALRRGGGGAVRALRDASSRREASGSTRPSSS